MLPHHAPAPQSAGSSCLRVGVGMDTSRYGDYAGSGDDNGGGDNGGDDN